VTKLLFQRACQSTPLRPSRPFAEEEVTAEEREERMEIPAEDPVSVRLRRSLPESRGRRFTETRALKMKRPTFPRRIVLPESRISTALPSPTREMSR